MSKGSRPRPFSVSQEQFANSFELIFGKKNKPADTVHDPNNDEQLISQFNKQNLNKPKQEDNK